MDNAPGSAPRDDADSHQDVAKWLVSQLGDLDAGLRPRGLQEKNDLGWMRHLGREAFRRVSDYPARDDLTRLAVTGVCGGDWPQGVEAVIRTALAPGQQFTRPQELAAFIRATVPAARVPMTRAAKRPRLAVQQVGLATTTGWSKARGDGHSDNEDASDFSRLEDGGLVAAVLDGVTGPNDGSGGRASQRALELIKHAWATGITDPADVLTRLRLDDDAEGVVYEGATVGVLCRIDPTAAKPLSIACVGDARAYLWLPGIRRVVRIGGEGSAVFDGFSEGTRADPADASVVTSYVDGDGVRGDIFEYSADLAGGAWVIILSDGACISRRKLPNELGGAPDSDTVGMGFDDWMFAGDLEAAADEAITPQHLAALLAVRSELLGGRDNATAVVIEVVQPPGHADAGFLTAAPVLADPRATGGFGPDDEADIDDEPDGESLEGDFGPDDEADIDDEPDGESFEGNFEPDEESDIDDEVFTVEGESDDEDLETRALEPSDVDQDRGDGGSTDTADLPGLTDERSRPATNGPEAPGATGRQEPSGHPDAQQASPQVTGADPDADARHEEEDDSR